MPQINWNSPVLKAIPNIIALLLLVLILIFVLVQFGFLRSCDIPMFSPIYYSIVGTPNLAIIYGEGVEQVGNPELLANAIVQRKQIMADMYPIDAVLSAEMLNQYSLIFVEAKKIDTATMQRFRNYLSKGGKLVWVGDSGTELGEDDYMCQRVNFKYLAAYQTDDSACEMLKIPEKDGDNNAVTCSSSSDCSSGYQCSSGQCVSEDYVSCVNHECGRIDDSGAKQICEQSGQKTAVDSWMEYSPNIPYDLEGGLCGKTFSEIVLAFQEEEASLKNKITTGGLSLYDDESFIVEDAQNIEACIDTIESLGLKLNQVTISQHCKFSSTYRFGANYWNRGPSETFAGDYVSEVNFANVLGVDFIDLSEDAHLTLRPILQSHPLITNYEIDTYLGTAPTCKVSTTRFPVRSNTIMSIDFGGGDWWPAIVVSNPLGPSVGGRGLIVYFAFPPESGLEDSQQGPGANLIDNIVDFAFCN